MSAPTSELALPDFPAPTRLGKILSNPSHFPAQEIRGAVGAHVHPGAFIIKERFCHHVAMFLHARFSSDERAVPITPLRAWRTGRPRPHAVYRIQTFLHHPIFTLPGCAPRSSESHYLVQIARMLETIDRWRSGIFVSKNWTEGEETNLDHVIRICDRIWERQEEIVKIFSGIECSLRDFVLTCILHDLPEYFDGDVAKDRFSSAPDESARRALKQRKEDDERRAIEIIFSRDRPIIRYARNLLDSYNANKPSKTAFDSVNTKHLLPFLVKFFDLIQGSMHGLTHVFPQYIDTHKELLQNHVQMVRQEIDDVIQKLLAIPLEPESHQALKNLIQAELEMIASINAAKEI